MAIGEKSGAYSGWKNTMWAHSDFLGLKKNTLRCVSVVKKFLWYRVEIRIIF
jgi:hypothetical protein